MTRVRRTRLWLLLGGAVALIVVLSLVWSSLSRGPDRAPPVDTPLAGDLPYQRIPWEGGPAYWRSFDKAAAAGWTDPSFFPIAIWYNGISSDAEATYDKSLGFNTYMGMWEGTQYPLFEANDVYWIGGPLNPTFTPDARNWVGRLIDDEVDGRFPPAEGRAHMQGILDGYPADGRFTYANFTRGVITTDMADRDAEAYVNDFTDAVSLDMYWYTVPYCDQVPYRGAGHLVPIRKDNCRTSSSYGRAVDGLRARDAADGELQAIWQFVEVYGGSDSDAGFGGAIRPEQLKGAVMNSVIHEARGIIYFNQSLSGPCQGGSMVRQVQMGEECAAAQVRAAGEVNNQLHQLAPVLNTQSYGYSFGSGLDTMLKTHDGAAYVFAMIDGESRPGRRTLELPAELRGRKVEVLFENRTITPDAQGRFTDTFAAESAYHIYRIG